MTGLAQDIQKSIHHDLETIYGDYHEFILREFPESATYNGDHRYDDKLTEMSIAAHNARMVQVRQFRERVLALPLEHVASEDKLNRELFLYSIDAWLEGEKFENWLMPLNQQSGLHIDFPLLFESHKFDTIPDFEKYVSRLSLFGRQVDAAIELMKEGVKKKIVPPKVVIQRVSVQLKNLQVTDFISSPMFTVPLAKLSKIEPPSGELKPLGFNPDDDISTPAKRIQRDFRKAARDIQEGYKRLREYVNSQYLPACRADVGEWSLPNGLERDNHAIKSHTSLNLSAEEIHDRGLKEVERINALMTELKTKMGFKGSTEEFNEHLRNDKQYFFSDKNELLVGFRHYLAMATSHLPEFFNRLPEANCDLKELEEFRAAAAPQAYYYPAPEDRSRPGYFYVNTTNLSARPKYTMTALTLHEAVPGHHLQIAISQELKNLPWFRREMSVTSFVEGWALYAERLGYECHMYDDDLQHYGALGFESWRACRLVVDAGIHAKKWTREQAISYLKKYTVNSEADIVSEVERYIAWAGQACAYKIGEMKIREIRQRAEQRLSAKFNIRDFHDKLLENGAVPLPVLDRIMDGWIEEILKK